MERDSLDSWVQKYLMKPKHLLDIIIAPVRWKCPECGQRWRIEPQRNEYLGTYTFKCTKCNKASGKVTKFHFFMN